MVKSDWPFLTRSPSRKLRDRRIPTTRARTSTSREPAVCAVYSIVTGRVCGWTLVTFTSEGGMPPPGPPCPLPPLSCPSPEPQAANARTSKLTPRCLKRIGIRGEELRGLDSIRESVKCCTCNGLFAPLYNRWARPLFPARVHPRDKPPDGQPGHLQARDRSERHAREASAPAL